MKGRYIEINRLLKESKLGREGAKLQLIKDLEGLVIKQINKYNYANLEVEDLIQEGNYTILHCIENYEADRGVYFLGYVKSMLRYRYLDLSARRKKERHKSLNETINFEENIELEDLLESDMNLLEGLINKENEYRVKESLKVLSKRQLQIIYLYYYKNINMKEISKILGVSYRSIVNTKVRALEKIKKELIK